MARITAKLAAAEQAFGTHCCSAAVWSLLRPHFSIISLSLPFDRRYIFQVLRHVTLTMPRGGQPKTQRGKDGRARRKKEAAKRRRTPLGPIAAAAQHMRMSTPHPSHPHHPSGAMTGHPEAIEIYSSSAIRLEWEHRRLRDCRSLRSIPRKLQRIGWYGMLFKIARTWTSANRRWNRRCSARARRSEPGMPCCNIYQSCTRRCRLGQRMRNAAATR